MSLKATAWVWDYSPLKGIDKLIHLELADHVNEERGDNRVWPSYATIAVRTGLSERAVKRTISKMTKMGLIDVEKRYGKSNYITLHLSVPEIQIPVENTVFEVKKPPASTPNNDCESLLQGNNDCGAQENDCESPIISNRTSNSTLINNLNPPTPLDKQEQEPQAPQEKSEGLGSIEEGLEGSTKARAPKKMQVEQKKSQSAAFSPGGIRDPGSEAHIRSRYGRSNI